MTRRLRQTLNWLDQPTLTRRRWTIGVNLALIVLFFGGGFGMFTYMSDQRADVERSAFATCVTRVGTRSDLRGVLIGIFDAIDERNPGGETVADLRVQLDENYPPLRVEDC
jgi:uncharacterized membrane protein YsdA (DUF1294 family)